MSTWKIRSAKAITLIVAGVLFCCVASWVTHPQESVYQEFARSAKDTPQAATGALSITDLARSSAVTDRQDIPAEIAEEVVGAYGFDQVRIGAGGRVVGVVSTDAPRVALDSLCAGLLAKGWKEAGDGGSDNPDDFVASFVKETGVYHWVTVSAVGVPKGSALTLTLA